MALCHFLAWLAVNSCLVVGQTPQYSLLGQKATFVTHIKNQPDEILWKHDGNKVVEFTGSEQKSFGSFQKRVSLDWYTADLNISNLRLNDSGLYELETFTNLNLGTKSYKLVVVEKVTKPAISCEIKKTNTSHQPGDHATLTCSLPSHYPQSLLKFQWSSNANTHLGPHLIISLGGENDDRIYRCTINNPLSEESATFIAKDCYIDKNSQAGLIAGILVPVLLLLILLCIGCFYLKVRLRNKKSDVEKQSPSDLNAETSSNNEERRPMLDRAPTFPSGQSLGHLIQNRPSSDPSQKVSSDNDKVVNEIKRRFSQQKEKNQNQDRENESLEDSGQAFSDPVAKENKNSPEAEPRDAIEENVLKDDPSDTEGMNADTTAVSDEQSLKASINEDKRASTRPVIPTKSEIVRRASALKRIEKNVPTKVDEKPALETEIEEVPAASVDLRSKKEAESSETSSPPVSPCVDQPTDDNKQLVQDKLLENVENKQDNPAHSKEPNKIVSDVQNNYSLKASINEDKRASTRPVIPTKSEIVRRASALKRIEKNVPTKVDEKPALETEIEEVPAASVDLRSKKEAESSETSSLPPWSPSVDQPTDDNKQLVQDKLLENMENKQEDNLKEETESSGDLLGKHEHENTENKEDNPVHSEETNDPFPDVQKNHNQEGKGASPHPEVLSKSGIVQGENDPAATGIQEAPAVSENQDSEKKEENEPAKSTSENDVQPPPVSMEDSSLSQISPKISAKDEDKHDMSPAELAGESTENGKEESAAVSTEEQENKDGSPAGTSKKIVSESAEDQQKPDATETEPQPELETLQKN